MFALIIAFVVVGMLAGVFALARANSAGLHLSWPESLSKIFASRSARTAPAARTISPPAPVPLSVSSSVGDVAVDVGGNTIKKLNGADGTVLWSASVSNEGTNEGVLAVDQLDLGVYTGNGSHIIGGTSTVYKYTASGELAWTNTISRSGTCNFYRVTGAAVDTTSSSPGVVWTQSGCYGGIAKSDRTTGVQQWSVFTNDIGRPSIDPSNGDIYAITTSTWNQIYKATTTGSLTSAASCNGLSDLNPADSMLYRGGGGCGITLAQMNNSSLGSPNWSMDLSGTISSFDVLAVQPWSGGYVYVGSVASSKIVVVDPATQTVVTSFTTVPLGNIAVNPAGGNIYIGNGLSNFVYAYSPNGTLVWTSPDLGGPVYNVAAPMGIVGTALTLGNYPDTTVQAGANTTVTPDAAPTNTTSMNVSTASAFKGMFAATPTTGVVMVTNAHPAGTYLVTVTAFNSVGATTTKTFTLTVTNPTPCDSPSFSGAIGSPFAAGTTPLYVAVGDFNGDGKQDFAVANSNSSNVTVLLGNGSGGFTPASGSPFAVGLGPFSVAVGDFNGDGKLDLTTSHEGASSNTVTVLLGDGSGGFSAASGSPFAVGISPHSVAVGDFNGDGKQDLATANNDSSNVTVLLGDGGGGFSAASGSPFAVGTNPRSVAVGDFNGDGKLDLATANFNSNNVTVLLGNGSGGFTAASASPFAVGSAPQSVVVGDFNGDGKLDLTTANNGSNNVTVLLGNGSGGFSPASGSPYAVGANPRSVAVGDFNGDGKPDLTTANQASNNASVLLGNGGGGFSPASGSPFGAGTQPITVAVGDFNGDGKQDLTTANQYSNNVTVLLNTCPLNRLSINDITVTEGDSGTVNAVFTVTLINPSGTVTVDYSTANNSASAGSDYIAAAGTLTLSSVTPTQTISIAVNGDTVGEANERFFVNLANPSGAVFADNQGQCTITNDDPAPTISINDAAAPEGNSGTRSLLFTVAMTGATNQNVTVGYNLVDQSATAGSDYVGASGTITLLPGETTHTLAVTLNGDTNVEGNETFRVDLSNPTNATLVDNQGIGTIIDDEGVTEPSLNTIWQKAQEGMTNVFGATTNGSLYVLVGNSGDIWTSPDSINWTKRTNPDTTSRDLRGVTFGGGQFVAVGSSAAADGGSLILTSPDGITWTQRSTVPVTRNLTGVAYGNGLYVATTPGGVVLTSPDAITWTQRQLGILQRLNGIAFGGGQFVAVGNERTVVTSSDGINWTLRGGIPTTIVRTLNSVTHDGSKFIAVSSDPSGARDSGSGVMTSPDGVNWTQQTVPVNQPLFGVTAAGGLIVAAGSGSSIVSTIITSPDGTNWTARAVAEPGAGVARSLRVVTDGPAGFLAADGRGNIFTSPDGIANWISRTLATSRTFYSVAHNGTTYCAVGANGVASTSPDGVNWTQQTTPDPTAYYFWSSITYGNGLFVASGLSDSIMTSPDGVNWTVRNPATPLVPLASPTSFLTDITYANGLFVVVGEAYPAPGPAVAHMITSPDGITWTTHDPGLSAATSVGFNWIAAAYGNGKFVVALTDGVTGEFFLLTSPDGQNWTRQPSRLFDPYETFLDIVFANGQFVAVGDRIWTSPDGVNWTLRFDYSNTFFNGLAYANNRYVTVGFPGSIYASTDGINWSPQVGATSHTQMSVTASLNGAQFVSVGDSAIEYAGFIPTISISDVTLTEGDSGTTAFIFTVTKMGGAALNSSVNFTTVDGTATTANDDYQAQSGSLTFLPADTTKTITVLVNGDTTFEPNEAFTVHLSGATDATISDADGAGTITNDDSAPTFAIDDITHNEGNGGTTSYTFYTFTVTKTGGTALNSAVNFTTVDGTATTANNDYQANASTLTFLPADTTKTITVLVSGDTTVEPDEAFTVHLSGASNATISDADGTGTITNDDSASTIVVSLPTKQNPPGGPSIIPITVGDTTGQGIGAYDFDISFNPSVLQPQATPFDATGTLSSGWSITPNTSVPGHLILNAFHTIDLTGQGVLLNLKFDVIGGGGSTSPLTWESFTFNEGTPGDTDVNGSFTVMPSISGHLNYQDSTSGARNVTMTLTGTGGFVTRTTTTDVNGDYTFAGVPAGNDYTVTPSRASEVHDLSITAFDASQAARFAALLITLSPNKQTAGDSSNNGFVTAFDASQIARYQAQIATSGSIAGSWKFTPASLSFTNLSANQTNQNLTAILVGDISGNWTPPAGPSMMRSPSGVAAIPVGFPNRHDPPGGPSTINITVGDLTNQSVFSYDFDMTFDPAVLQPQDPAFDATGTLSSGWAVFANTSTPGHVTGNAFGTSAMAGQGILLALKFNVVGAEGSQTPLTWVSFNFNEGDPPDTTFNGQFTATGPTAAPALVSGRITTPDGSPLGGAVMHLSGAATRTTISDSAGNYRFENVQTDHFYSVTPALANYSFAPASRSFSLTGNMTDAGFTAYPDAVQSANAIDMTEYFVRQQYLDFLGREPDQGGFEYWSAQINQCGSDATCIRDKRIDVSAAFFMSAEFQQTGSFIYRPYRGGLGRQIGFAEFSTDRAQVVGGANLEEAKTAYAQAFVQRPEFVSRYEVNITAESFVDAVLQTVGAAGADLSAERGNLITAYNSGDSMNESRALVLRTVADNATFTSVTYNPAFVLMEYFGYLRRDVDQGGYDFWLDVLNNGSPGNYRGMVCAFLTSTEYQQRFSPIITRANAECTR